MHKVVIVDDEIRQSRGLKNILLRLFKNLEIEAFTDASAALEFIDRERVKIIITDICMPEMDGLELTQRIKDLGYGSKIILLTGFAEFEYARKAITLGAFDYLLKPMNPQKLKAELERAINEVEAEHVLSEQQEHLQKQLNMTLPVYMEKLLNQWVYGWASKDEKREIEDIIPTGSGGMIIAAKLKGLHIWQQNFDKEEVEERKKQISWNMRELFSKPYHVLSFFSHILPETMITLITCTVHNNELSAYFSYQRIMSKLQKHTSDLWNDLEITLGLGIPNPNFIENVQQCYKSAVTVLEYGFYFPSTRILDAGVILSKRIPNMNISLAEEEFIKDAIRENDPHKAQAALENVMERCMNNGYPEPKQLRNNCESLLRHAALSLQSDIIWQVKENDLAQESYELFIDSAKAYLAALAEDINLKNTGRKSEFSEKFKEYLNENYKEDISLENIAEYFHLTPAYFSAFVKEVTGTSFSKSLIQIRIRKSKELLKETKLKVYEIAEEIGYNDVKYFNRVFKKEIGITPIQYREDLKDMEE